jgi:hypothetical protein
MAKDLIIKLVLSEADIGHIFRGGVLSVKIKGKERDASVEISRGEIPEQRSTRIRFKTINAE